MSTAFESIKAGLTEAIAHVEGKAVGAKLHQPSAIDVKAVDVKAISTQVGKFEFKIKGYTD